MSRLVQVFTLRSHFVLCPHQPRTRTKPNPQWQSRYFSNVQTAKKIVDLNPEKDVTRSYVLYRIDNLKSLKLLQLVSFGIFGLGLYLATFIRRFIVDEPSSVEKKRITEAGRDESANFYSAWETVAGVENKYKWSLLSLCLIISYGSIFLTGTFISRSIQSLTLVKGGREVIVKTPTSFSFIPKLMERTVPVNHFSSLITREHAKSYLPVKIKGNRFYYLLRIDGHFPNPLLFDKTVGRSRKLVA